MKKLTKSEAMEKMLQSGGKIFRAVFIKKDGSVREIICRRGVSKGVKGVGMKYNPLKRNLVPVYDMTQAQAFRMINVDTLTELKIEGKEYQVQS